MNTAKTVGEFMARLRHPRKAEMALVLDLIRTADPAITKGIKWNAPSFAVGEHFATLNARDQDAVQIILHLGAKVRHDVSERIPINDPKGVVALAGQRQGFGKVSRRT